MRISDNEMMALRRADEAERRSALAQNAVAFLFQNANRLPADANGLTSWIKRASGYLYDLTSRYPDLGKAMPEVVAELRIQIGIAEAKKDKLQKAASKPAVSAPPAAAQTKPTEANAAQTVPATNPAPAPLTVSTPATEGAKPTGESAESRPATNNPHHAKQVILDRAAQASLRQYGEEIKGIHAAIRRYEGQLASSNAHTRHAVELKRRVASLRERLIQVITAKSRLRDAMLNPTKFGEQKNA